MKKKTILAVMTAVSFSVMFTACNNKDASGSVATTAAETTTAEAASVSAATEVFETASAKEDSALEAETVWETIAPDDVDVSDYEISKGIWFYTGVEDEKSIDMDGLKGLTTYTAEAIPENEGYLQYLGVNPDGQHVFDVYDLFGRYFMRMTFVSDEQFYINDDESNYYVKWDY